MDKGKIGTLTIGITVAILLAVFIFIMVLTINQDRPKIVLPNEDSVSDLSDEGAGGGENELISRVEITRNTVQDVVETTLEHPEAYQRTLAMTTFWTGGKGTTTVKSYVDGSRARYDMVLPDAQTRHMIRTEETTYIWYNSERAVTEMNTGNFSEEDEQWIPTYEDLLDIDTDQIADAGYTDYHEVGCIYAATKENENGYSERYWVSVENGLLIAAERLKEGRAVYRMEEISVALHKPEAEKFTLPDGRVIGTEAADG